MSRNIKFRWFHLTVVALLVVVSSSVISSSGELENAQEAVRQNPNDAKAHYNLGNAYVRSGQHQDAIASFKESSCSFLICIFSSRSGSDSGSPEALR